MSSDATPRLGLPDMPETPELYPDIVADGFARLDAFSDLYLKGQFVNTPPSSPSDGDCYLTGGSPSGAWSGQAYKIAACRDGAWTMLTPFNGLRAYVAATGAFIVYENGVWTDWTALIGAGEASIASAATCDIGAAGSLFLQVTGTAAITGLGNAANRLRFLRFAGALTLTHNATSLILPGAANIVTAAGDCALFTSDAGGNWRCRHYARADGRMVNLASPAFTGTMTAAAATFSGTVTAPAFRVGNYNTYGLYAQVSGGGYAPLLATAGNNTFFYNTNGAGSMVFRNAADTTTIFALADGGAMTYGGVTLANSVTGTGSMVLSAAPAFSGDITFPGGIWRSGGFLGVGTTANGGVTGLANGEFRGGNGVYSLSVYNAGTGVPLYVRGTSTATLVQFNLNGTDGGTISQSGGTTSYNTTSDARLKTVAAEQRDWRDAIRALWVGEFDKYADFNKRGAGARSFGIVAQQAHAALGGLGITAPADERDVWMASAEPFAFLALWGVKDLYAMIEALAARVAALEAAHAGS